MALDLLAHVPEWKVTVPRCLANSEAGCKAASQIRPEPEDQGSMNLFRAAQDGASGRDGGLDP